MMLIDILSVIDENKKTLLLLNDKIVSYYDGKNSIDTVFNFFRVSKISTENNNILIEITK